MSHELLTPIKCIGALSLDVIAQLPPGKLKYKAGLVHSTSKLLLSQVKVLLDKSMLDQNTFQAQLEVWSLQKIMDETCSIMLSQSVPKKIYLHTKFEGSDLTLTMDKMRTQ